MVIYNNQPEILMLAYTQGWQFANGKVLKNLI